MKSYLLFIGTVLFLTNLVLPQSKETYTKQIGRFTIEVNDVQTKHFAELSNRRADSINKSSRPNWVPDSPPTAFFKRRSKINFLIKPENYFQYDLRHVSNETAFKEFDYLKVLKVNRKSLLGSEFNPLSFNVSVKWDFNRSSADEFKIIEIDKTDRREICGFDCYKVILKKKIRMVKLYVTDSISLNYNPAFTNPHLLKNFYPLYVKEYLDGFPNDVYKEYIFHKL